MPYSARRDHPMQYAEIMGTVRWMREALPRSMTIRVGESPPWDSPDVLIIVRSSLPSSIHPGMTGPRGVLTHSMSYS